MQICDLLLSGYTNKNDCLCSFPSSIHTHTRMQIYEIMNELAVKSQLSASPCSWSRMMSSALTCFSPCTFYTCDPSHSFLHPSQRRSSSLSFILNNCQAIRRPSTPSCPLMRAQGPAKPGGEGGRETWEGMGVETSSASGGEEWG